MCGERCELHVVRTAVVRSTLKRRVVLCACAVCAARLLYVARCTLYAVRFVQQRCTLYAVRCALTWHAASKPAWYLFIAHLHPPNTGTCGECVVWCGVVWCGVVWCGMVYISSVVPNRAGIFSTAVGRPCIRYQYLLIIYVGESKPTFRLPVAYS